MNLCKLVYLYSESKGEHIIITFEKWPDIKEIDSI